MAEMFTRNESEIRSEVRCSPSAREAAIGQLVEAADRLLRVCEYSGAVDEVEALMAALAAYREATK